MVLFAIDADGVFTLSEGRGLESLGLQPGQVVGLSVRDVYAGAPEVLAQVERALAGEEFSSDVQVADIHFETHYTPAFDDHGDVRLVIGVATDVTEQRHAEARLAHLAFHDPLTALPNRASLEAELTRALGEAREGGHPLAVLRVDLDEFALVNDSLGHAAGDELLRQLPDRLRPALPAGALLARHGDDEFTVVLERLGPHPDCEADALAGRLLDALAEPFTCAGAQLQARATVGASIYPRDGEHGPELLRNADAALADAKRTRRGAILLHRARTDDPGERLQLRHRLALAIDRDELELHYQPLVDLHCNGLHGLEALVRWRDPERGLVPPGQFIPVAEHTGLIEPLGEWVLRELCRQAVAWRARGLEPMLSFNVSPRQLRAPGFPAMVADVIAASGLPARQLTAEITETALMLDRTPANEALGELHRLGLGLAIDDFGAEYSSLARLRDLPVDTLKLDRAFLRGVPDRPEATAVVHAVLELAGALGLQALVEGVETPAQCAYLLAEGCPLAQGYLFARPLPAADATKLLLDPHGLVAGGASSARVTSPDVV
jgi:diguanylate cyclase (GGDEF)-like protein/PAS domain S-box-containing protein